jgi:cyclopropane fatty-acyl-phospholipid synthase-like methyltransferase
MFNAPLSEERAASLVRRLAIAPGRHVLDLGCGWGELLLRIVAAHPATTGTGVDLDRASLDRGRRLAAERGLADRVDFVEADARGFEDRGGIVLCIGASHAWGSVRAALGAAHGHVERGGLALFADGYWAREPGPEASAIFGALPCLDDVREAAAAAGFRLVSSDRSTLQEWDAFEAGWRAGLEETGKPEALRLAAQRKREYETVYRGVLGFGWLVLSST